MFNPSLVVLSLAVALATAHAACAGEPGPDSYEESEPGMAAAAPAAPIGPEPGRIMRTYAGFVTDAETLRGFWAGMDADYGREEDVGEYNRWTLNTRLAYGADMWEAGVQIPYTWIGSDGSFGNMALWGKVLPIRTEIFQAGGGLVVYAPTGDDQSAEDWGFRPFATAALAAGPVSLRGMIGYQRYVQYDASDAVVYNAAALAPCGDHVVLRAEFDGAHYPDYDTDAVSFVPGVDVAFPMGIGELVLRLGGTVGITKSPADWGLSFGLAYAQI
jgi:hypothetical protein